MEALDIRRRAGDRARGFVWELAVSSMAVGEIQVTQVNLVLLLSAIDRVYGGFADLGPHVIDYRVISPVLADAKFRSQRTVRTMDPQGAVLVYFSGKLLCVGTKTALDAIVSIYKAVRVLNNYRLDDHTEFVIGNISFVNSVFKGTCGHELNMHVLMGKDVYGRMLIRYEPDLFPGCVMTLLHEDGTAATGSMVVYWTGRFVLAGCCTATELRNAAEELERVVMTMPGLCGPPNTAGRSETEDFREVVQHMRRLNMLPELEIEGI